MPPTSAIVVGAGVFGAAIADRLARADWDVTLVDQFEPGDPRASSGGESRLLRCSHGSDRWHTSSAWRSRELWRELDPELFVEVGVIWAATSSSRSSNRRPGFSGLRTPCARWRLGPPPTGPA